MFNILFTGFSLDNEYTGHMTTSHKNFNIEKRYYISLKTNLSNFLSTSQFSTIYNICLLFVNKY